MSDGRTDLGRTELAGRALDPRRWQVPPAVGRLGRSAFIAGAVAALLTAAGYFVDPQQFFRSYLVAYVYVLSIALGCFAVLMLHHLTHGQWGLVMRRPLEAATRTLPWLAVLFVPIALGLPELYEWARPEAVAADELLQYKQPYLNVPFFLGRTVFYFAAWLGCAWLLERLSRRQDATGDPDLQRRLRVISGPALGLFCLTASFASFDWLMSLDAHWYSTLYGVYFVGGTGLSAFAFVAVAALYLSQREPMDRVLVSRHFHDYGKLMLAFVMLWAYFSFSQFLITWSGNLPEEITFYLARMQGGWQLIGLALIVAHFGLPFVLLLSRDLKRHARSLATVAALVLVMRWVDLYWQVAPFFDVGFLPHWLDLVTVVALTGLWLGLFTRELARRPLLPLGDPDITDVVDMDVVDMDVVDAEVVGDV